MLKTFDLEIVCRVTNKATDKRTKLVPVFTKTGFMSFSENGDSIYEFYTMPDDARNYEDALTKEQHVFLRCMLVDGRVPYNPEQASHITLCPMLFDTFLDYYVNSSSLNILTTYILVGCKKTKVKVNCIR